MATPAKKTTKKRNTQDTTVLNNRKTRRDIADLASRVARLERAMGLTRLGRR